MELSNHIIPCQIRIMEREWCFCLVLVYHAWLISFLWFLIETSNSSLGQDDEIIKWGVMITKHRVVTYWTLSWWLNIFKSWWGNAGIILRNHFAFFCLCFCCLSLSSVFSLCFALIISIFYCRSCRSIR